jgi:peptide/nickel transport system substrate-binding protein
VFADSIASLSPVDGLTLEVELKAANAHFDKMVERSSLNFIASAKAIADRVDLNTKPVGAGPFTLDQWRRDDRMTLDKNPDWVGGSGPYLDRLTFVVLPDETQRVDTFNNGAADAFYTAVTGSVASALRSIRASYPATVPLTTGQVWMFNTRRPPFDDVRVRKAVVQGVNREVLANDILDGSTPADNFTVAGSPWFDANAALPKYDPVAAQKLIDEYVAEKGGQPIKFAWLAFPTALDQARATFIFTSLNQLKNIHMDLQTLGVADITTRMLVTKDFQVASWGAPVLDPEPILYAAVKSGLQTNASGYSNSVVDKAVSAARVSTNVDDRKKLYDIVWEALALDLPYVPYVVVSNGFVCAPKLVGCTVYGDGVLRWDLVWLNQ